MCRDVRHFRKWLIHCVEINDNFFCQAVDALDIADRHSSADSLRSEPINFHRPNSAMEQKIVQPPTVSVSTNEFRWLKS